jgi:hypothetical protein
MAKLIYAAFTSFDGYVAGLFSVLRNIHTATTIGLVERGIVDHIENQQLKSE